jgi:hypothetical protein
MNNNIADQPATSYSEELMVWARSTRRRGRRSAWGQPPLRDLRVGQPVYRPLTTEQR